MKGNQCFLIPMVLSAVVAGCSFQSAPSPEEASEPERDSAFGSRPSPPPPEVNSLEKSFEQVLPELLRRSQQGGNVDRDRFWRAFCEWLDEQAYVPQKTRDEFRRALRAELGMAPEQQ